MVLIFPKRGGLPTASCSVERPAGHGATRLRVWQKPGAAGPQTAPRPQGENRSLQIGVALAQHGREPGGFLFAPPFLTGLFKMAMIANRLQDSLAVNFLLEPPQRPLHRFTLLESNFRQSLLTSSPGPQTGTPCAGRFSGPEGAYGPSGGGSTRKNTGKRPKSGAFSLPPAPGRSPTSVDFVRFVGFSPKNVGKTRDQALPHRVR